MFRHVLMSRDSVMCCEVFITRVKVMCCEITIDIVEITVVVNVLTYKSGLTVDLH